MSYFKEKLPDAIRNAQDFKGRQFLLPRVGRTFSPSSLPGREGHPTDTKTFSEVQKDGGIKSLVKYFRSQYPRDPLNIAQVDELNYTFYTLPIYLGLRANDPSEVLPSSFINTSYAAEGIRTVTEALCSVYDNKTVMTPEQIYDFANGNNPWGRNFFIGEIREGDNTVPSACSAPQEVIEPMLGAMVFFPDTEIDPSKMEWGGLIKSPADISRSIEFANKYFEYRTAELVRLRGGVVLESDRFIEQDIDTILGR